MQTLRTRPRRGSPPDRLARGLGWFSVGLGLAQLTIPRRLARFMGVPDHQRTRTALLAVGVRELAAGTGILSRRRPTGWLWARVAGDLMDLGLLGLALRGKRAQRRRVAASLGAVAGVLALDALAARRHTGGHLYTEAVTINQPIDQVTQLWAELQKQEGFISSWDEVADVELASAPGTRGTEIRVHLRGMLAVPRIKSHLRRLKQLIETGEVIYSDASIHHGMHAARPPRQEELS